MLSSLVGLSKPGLVPDHGLHHKEVMQLRVGSSFLQCHASPILTREIEVTSKENDGIPRFTGLVRRLWEHT